MARVLQTPEVADDLLAIGEFVAEDSQSLEVAFGLLDRIDQKCRLYAGHPAMGTTRPRTTRFVLTNWLERGPPIRS